MATLLQLMRKLKAHFLPKTGDIYAETPRRARMLIRRLLLALPLSLPAATSAWEESFPAVSKAWDEQQVLTFILAHSPVLRAYGVVTKEYTPSTPMQRVLEHTSTPAEKFVYTSRRQRLACIGPLERLGHGIQISRQMYQSARYVRHKKGAITLLSALCGLQTITSRLRVGGLGR
jgi:hypothetical protein